MVKANSDGTYTCGHEGCHCTVADDENHLKHDGKIFCSEECRDGKGCNHPDCNCGSSD